jgi:hypothetical protein
MDLHDVAEQSCGFPLSEAERALLDQASNGLESTFEADVDVRPALLRWLMTAEAARPLFQGSGLRVDRVRVTGDLDLRATTITTVVRFRRVTIDGQLLLSLARTRTIILQACRIDHLDLDSATIDGALHVEEFDGEGCRLKLLNLSDAKVSGNIDIRYARFAVDQDSGKSVPGIDLTRTSIGGSVFIAPGNIVNGGIIGVDLRVGGNLGLVDLVATRPAGTASVNLTGARIDGSLYMQADDNRLVPSDERLHSNKPTEVSGAVLLARIKVGGSADLTGLTVHRRNSAPEDSEVGWWGIDLLDAVVGGTIYLNKAAVWDSGVRLSYAHVSGNVECDELVLMRSSRGKIEGTASRPESDGAGSPTGPSLEMVLASVGKVLIWRVVAPSSERVVLNGSRVGAFEYSSVYWPDRSELEFFTFSQIRALTYPPRRPWLSKWARETLQWSANNPPAGTLKGWLHDVIFKPDTSHLDWIRTSTREGWEFDRSLYEHVAAALTRQGQPEEARRVLITATNDGNRAKGWLSVLLSLPYRLFAGNGYRPQFALWWALGLVLLGAMVFGRAYEGGALVPIDPDAVAQPFQRIVYSADVLLPIIDLGQARNFEAAGADSGFVRLYLWLQISLGWIIATTLGAAAAGFVRRSGSN